MSARFPNGTPLTPTELAVFQAISLRAPEIVDYRQIARFVWASDYIAETDQACIRVHVARIRKRLGADAIETVRGHGYRCEASR